MKKIYKIVTSSLFTAIIILGLGTGVAYATVNNSVQVQCASLVCGYNQLKYDPSTLTFTVGNSGSMIYASILDHFSKFGNGNTMLSMDDNIGLATLDSSIIEFPYLHTTTPMFHFDTTTGEADFGETTGLLGTGYTRITPGTIRMTSVPAYADDSAATTGGLVTGDVYETTVSGSTLLKIVP